MPQSSRGLKTFHVLMVLAVSTLLVWVSNAAAFSSGDEAQVAPEIGVGAPFHSSNPALITDRSHAPSLDNDFMRITFLPASVPVTTPARPGVALRSFFGSTRFYDPPIQVEQIANFNGFAAEKDKDLVAMRCRPQRPDADPYLATWPNLAKMLVSPRHTAYQRTAVRTAVVPDKERRLHLGRLRHRPGSQRPWICRQGSGCTAERRRNPGAVGRARIPVEKPEPCRSQLPMHQGLEV